MIRANPRILVSNDDGIHAPGLEILEAVARQFSDDVWVIAPESEQSGAGHSLTLSRPLRVRQVEDKRFAVEGTPTDCVMMGVIRIMQGVAPDLILSGINRGGNLAEDITYSGTVSVAMEGTLAAIPSIAFSQCTRPGRSTDWQTAERFAPKVLGHLLAHDGLASLFEPGVLLNVNFPAIPADDVLGIHVTRQGQRELKGVEIEHRVDPRGFDYYWFGLGREVGALEGETDLKAVRTGHISITPLHLNLTHRSSLGILSDLMDGF